MNTVENNSAGQSTVNTDGIEVIPAVKDGEVKVSVIIPIFNEGAFLSQTLERVTNQTLREIEIICVDDGSTDDSLEILKKYQKRDERVRIVTETNAGPGLARNNGLRRARGEFIAFLDADDIIEPTLLEELYKLSVKDELDMAIVNYDVYNITSDSFEKVAPCEHADIYEEGKVTSKSEHPDHIFLSTNGAAWNKLFRTSFVLDKKLQFLPDVKLYEDVYFVITALSLAERIGKVFKTLIHHRVYSEQLRAKNFRTYYYQIPVIYLQIKEFLTQHGMYSPLSYSFRNLTASRCYKIFNLLDAESKEALWNLLYSEQAEKLDWVGLSAEDFESRDVFEFVAHVEMYDYKQYERRRERGLELPLDRIATLQMSRSTRKKARTFMGKIFRKKAK